MENFDEVYQRIASCIIKRQAQIIGANLAYKKARKINKFLILEDGTVSKVYGNPVSSLEELISEYANLSGEVAIQFSKDAIRQIIQEYPQVKLPRQL